MFTALAGRQIMLDIETFGVRPGDAIRSIGLVEFSFDGRLAGAHYWNIEDQSSEAAGLRFDKGTVAYWERQPASAQAVFRADPQPLARVLTHVSDVILNAPFPSTLWADGSHFDFPILTAAYEAVGQRTPWKNPQLRDARTVLEMFGFDARDMPPPPEPRTAAGRALFQAQCLVTCVKQAVNAVIALRPKRSVFE